MHYEERWGDMREKRQRINAFLDDPTRDKLHSVFDHRGFWGTRARKDIDHYTDELVLKRQSPEKVAQTILDALKDEQNIAEVNELDGFGWATTSEFLHVLRPKEYALLNKRSEAAMQKLGYSTPSRQTASVEHYLQFCDDVKDAEERYALRNAVESSSNLPKIPDWATPLEIADCAFDASYDGAIDLSAIMQAQNHDFTLIIPEKIVNEIDELVEGGLYRDREDVCFSAIRRELDHAK